jgi:hypothetical protein
MFNINKNNISNFITKFPLKNFILLNLNFENNEMSNLMTYLFPLLVKIWVTSFLIFLENLNVVMYLFSFHYHKRFV